MVEDAFRDLQQALLEQNEVKAESRHLDVATTAHRAHVLEAGEGPPLVFVPGLGLPVSAWAPLWARLQSTNTLYGIDLPGFGLSGGSVDFTDDYRANAIRFLDEVLAHLDLDEVTLVANSLGSAWISWFAVERPTRVRALIHIGFPALVVDGFVPLTLRLLASPLGPLLTTVRPPSPRQVDRLATMLGQPSFEVALTRLLVAGQQMPDHRPMFLATLRRLLGLRRWRPDIVLRPRELSGIAAPTLLILGRDDPMGSPDAGRRLQAALPVAQLDLIPGGHLPWLDQPDEVGALVAGFTGAINGGPDGEDGPVE